MSTRSTTVREPVSQTAARFEARARAARWRSRRTPLVAALAAIVLLLLGALAWVGPLLVVRSVVVTGLSGTEAAAVRSVGQAERGTPLLRVDAAAVGARVGRLPYVAQVRVGRQWPSTLRLAVTRRVPVAAVPRGDGRFQLVDSSGTSYQVVAAVPRAVPVVSVPLTGGSRDALAAALAVLEGLPGTLRSKVSQVNAVTAQDVRMRLGSAQVVWGSADEVSLKVKVLSEMLRLQARVYDVSSPRAPAVR